MAADCLFCKIIAGDIPSVKIYEDDVCVAFNDIDPQAPFHLLIVPREHVDSLDTSAGSDKDTLGHLLLTAAEIARNTGISENG
ncbi:MAG: HIT domain-containing protein, partial [Pyrinomonadaceae bacterium]